MWMTMFFSGTETAPFTLFLGNGSLVSLPPSQRFSTDKEGVLSWGFRDVSPRFGLMAPSLLASVFWPPKGGNGSTRLTPSTWFLGDDGRVGKCICEVQSSLRTPNHPSLSQALMACM